MLTRRTFRAIMAGNFMRIASQVWAAQEPPMA